MDFGHDSRAYATGDGFAGDEEGEPGQDDEDDAGDVGLDDVIADLAAEGDLHDDARVGQVVVVGGVAVGEQHVHGELGQGDVGVHVAVVALPAELELSGIEH